MKQSFSAGVRRGATVVMNSVAAQLHLVFFLFCFSKSCEFVLWHKYFAVGCWIASATSVILHFFFEYAGV